MQPLATENKQSTCKPLQDPRQRQGGCLLDSSCPSTWESRGQLLVVASVALAGIAAIASGAGTGILLRQLSLPIAWSVPMRQPRREGR
jgi:hypothetical protein